MPSLAELIGRNIVIRSIPLDEHAPAIAKLHAVEDGGIWVESQKAMEGMLQYLERTSAPRTLVYFLPFAQISWVMSSVDSPYISDSIMK
jgi:hypothetical protein